MGQNLKTILHFSPHFLIVGNGFENSESSYRFSQPHTGNMDLEPSDSFERDLPSMEISYTISNLAKRVSCLFD